MTQQPFSRPGAIDLSGLKAPAPQSGSAAPGGAAAAGGSSYAVEVTEESFQAVIETSMTAPLLLVFYSPTRMPESQQLADDFVTLSTEFEPARAPTPNAATEWSRAPRAATTATTCRSTAAPRSA
jgi:putative thioredoxin